jgi:protein-L-isoaspartate(D-aspartate) O-methyltransferase
LQLEVGDGWKGWPASAPYDAIHVGAAAARVPDALVDQLAPGGRLVIPVGPEGETQSLAVIDKRKDGTISRHDTMSVMYVPLTTREHQLMSTR